MTWNELVIKIGYNPSVAGRKILLQIWELIGQNYRVLEDGKTIVIPDNIESLIQENGIKVNQLAKPWRKYKCSYSEIITEQE